MTALEWQRAAQWSRDCAPLTAECTKGFQSASGMAGCSVYCALSVELCRNPCRWKILYQNITYTSTRLSSREDPRTCEFAVCGQREL